MYRWLRRDASFHARYSQAHEDRADTLTDQMLEIADHAAEDASIEGVAAAKLRVETRRWIAAKLRPQKWGDKVIHQQQGSVSIRIGVPRLEQGQQAQVVEMVEEVAPRSGSLRLGVGSKA